MRMLRRRCRVDVPVSLLPVQCVALSAVRQATLSWRGPAMMTANDATKFLSESEGAIAKAVEGYRLGFGRWPKYVWARYSIDHRSGKIVINASAASALPKDLENNPIPRCFVYRLPDDIPNNEVLEHVRNAIRRCEVQP
jgi:hypothetical protein